MWWVAVSGWLVRARLRFGPIAKGDKTLQKRRGVTQIKCNVLHVLCAFYTQRRLKGGGAEVKLEVKCEKAMILEKRF